MAAISIIMPVYNGEKYLKECIESVIAQTFSDWELIIVNDGSTDKSDSICKSYADKDNRIKVIYQKNAGVSAARNRAMENITGKYVTFIDCDDKYTENRLKVMFDLMEEHGECDCVYSEFYEINDDGKIKEQTDKIVIHKLKKAEYVDNVFLFQKLNSVWRYMMKAEIAKTIKFNPLKFSEDYFYLLEYAQKVNVVLHTNQKLYYYRKNNTASMTQNTKNRKYINDYKIIPQLVYKYIKKNHLTGVRYQYKLAREYAYSGRRIIKATSYKEFLTIMNDPDYRSGLSYAKFDVNNKLKGFIFLLIKYKVYLPFLFLKK